ncbi:alpha/beta hydrolase [Flammeovirgaceae bacterium SG7u.111]|nr:alpha/beta hydrolase [Flammeovirgaceae bacterium SG7u.132]WPO34144.1 alpha/beta hydrolase [Flammeovirgaceae bacterium SG7u.111]
MKFNIKEENGFKFLDEGEGEVLILLHGLFGALSNWETVISHFSQKYRVVIPMMPIYDMPLKEAGLEGLVEFISKFFDYKGFNDVTLIGNSLGGHVALIYTLRHQEKVNRLLLTGSSGLFENTMGGSYPKRGSYEFVKTKVAYTFYDPEVATKELVDEVFEVTKSIPKCMRIVAMARSAQRHNMAEDIKNIHVPTLLIWGLNDTITPPMVAHEFDRLIPNTELHFIDKCGHVPMMEHSEVFNKLFEEFLEKTKVLI